MKNQKPLAIQWRNQKYILAHDTIPEGLYTIATYAKDVLRIKLNAFQQRKFGMMARNYQMANKIEPQFVKDKRFTAVRVYEKSLLDIVFMEFAQAQK